MLRFLTAGESHGQALVMTLDGMPAGLELDIDALNAQLRSWESTAGVSISASLPEALRGGARRA